jgi:hypothetical protein
MKLFNTLNLRRATFVVLLAWLFGLAPGVANACLLEAREGHHHGSHEIDEISIGAAGALESHDDRFDASKAPCLKFCDDGSNSPVRQQSTLDMTDLGHAPVIVGAWLAMTTALHHLSSARPSCRDLLQARPSGFASRDCSSSQRLHRVRELPFRGLGLRLFC